MELDGSQHKHETYKALQVSRLSGQWDIGLTLLIQRQRHIHELTLNARINWELPWAQIPAQDKVSLYQVVRIATCSWSYGLTWG